MYFHPAPPPGTTVPFPGGTPQTGAPGKVDLIMPKTFESYETFMTAIRTLTPDDPESVLFVNITPALAEEILAHDPRNRRAREAHIDRYARLMLSGQWNPAISEAIMFLEDGRMANGQHRLKAVVRAKVSILARVIRVTSTLGADEGVRRTLPDELVLTAHVDPKDKAIAASIVQLLLPDPQSNVSEGLTVFKQNRDRIMECITLAQTWLAEKDAIRRAILPTTLIAITRARMVFLEKLPDRQVDEFLQDMIEGGNANDRARRAFDHLFQAYQRREKGITAGTLAQAVKYYLSAPPGSRLKNPFDKVRRKKKTPEKGPETSDKTPAA